MKPEDKIATLAELLAEDRGLALVFVRTRRGADRLVKKLAFHQIDAVALHGDLNQGQRERALRRFESGHATTLVATDVAARGLDLADITHVINFDPPAEHSGYVHRVGRTGRAGAAASESRSSCLTSRRDVSRVARIAGHAEQFASGRDDRRPAAARLLVAARPLEVGHADPPSQDLSYFAAASCSSIQASASAGSNPRVTPISPERSSRAFRWSARSLVESFVGVPFDVLPCSRRTPSRTISASSSGSPLRSFSCAC